MKSLLVFMFLMEITLMSGSPPAWAELANSTPSDADCYSTLTAQDVQTLGAITTEVSNIPFDASTAVAQAKFEAILKRYQAQLSPTAQQALVADFHQRTFAALATQLQSDPLFAKAYLNFGNEIQSFQNNRKKFLGGVRGVNSDLRRLKRAQDKLIAQLQVSPIETTLKKELILQVYSLALHSYEIEDARANDAIRELSLTEVAAGTVLSIDLIGLSLVSSGLSAGASAAVLSATGSSMAELLTSTAIAAASTSASSVGLNELSDLSELLGHAAVNQSQADGFFCQVASSMDEQTPELVHDALLSATVGAVMGGALKLGFTFLAKTPLAKKIPVATIGKILGTGFRGIRIFEAISDGTQVYKLVKQAHEAEAAGDEKKAVLLIQQAKEFTIDAGVDSLTTVFGYWLSVKRSQSNPVATAPGTPPPPTFGQLLNQGWQMLLARNP